MASTRCTESDLKFINSEVIKNRKASPYSWTQETVVAIALRAYRNNEKIVRILISERKTYGDKVKAIEEILNS